MKNLIPLFLYILPGLLWAQAGPNEFIGTDGNWFNPANWSTGALPDADTDVLIPAGSVAQIDPSSGPLPVAVRDIEVADGAILRLLPGSMFEYKQLIIDDGFVEAFSSELSGDELIMRSSRADTTPGLTLQPTTNDNRSIKITTKTSVMHLGGLDPASQGNIGPGHYATMLADELELGGRLQVLPVYGFEPSVGDSFQIMTARDSLIGQFDDLSDGSVVARIGEVDLVIEYASDGVVLRGTSAPPAAVSVPGLSPLGRVLLVLALGLAAVISWRHVDTRVARRVLG